MFTSLDSVKSRLIDLGFQISDPWDIVDAFEKLVANYSGSKYAVSVDNCTDAVFLCLKYLNASGEITVPARTYISVPQAIIHAGCNINFEDREWSGFYQLSPLPIIDGATRFTKGMYLQDTYHCLSFHIKKTLPIGKGGMILTNDKKAYDWFKMARYEGRDITKPYDQDKVKFCGWNMYMPPEQAARGIEIFLSLADENPDCGGSWKYPDLREFPLFKGGN